MQAVAIGVRGGVVMWWCGGVVVIRQAGSRYPQMTMWCVSSSNLVSFVWRFPPLATDPFLCAPWAQEDGLGFPEGGRWVGRASMPGNEKTCASPRLGDDTCGELDPSEPTSVGVAKEAGAAAAAKGWAGRLARSGLKGLCRGDASRDPSPRVKAMPLILPRMAMPCLLRIDSSSCLLRIDSSSCSSKTAESRRPKEEVLEGVLGLSSALALCSGLFDLSSASTGSGPSFSRSALSMAGPRLTICTRPRICGLGLLTGWAARWKDVRGGSGAAEAAAEKLFLFPLLLLNRPVWWGGPWRPVDFGLGKHANMRSHPGKGVCVQWRGLCTCDPGPGRLLVRCEVEGSKPPQLRLREGQEAADVAGQDFMVKARIHQTLRA